jgi:hypothetical protein
VFWPYLVIQIQIGLAVNNSDKYRVIQEETNTGRFRRKQIQGDSGGNKYRVIQKETKGFWKVIVSIPPEGIPTLT